MTYNEPNPKDCLNDLQTTLHFRLLGGLSEGTADRLITEIHQRYQESYQPVLDSFIALMEEVENFEK